MLRKRLERDRANAGIAEWKPNALRHSFASYALRYSENANAVALEMGHSDADLLFKHYRELVLPAEARKYWNLVPTTRTGQKKVIPMAA
jgi:integrase